MPELTACVHSGVVQFATPSGGRGRAKTNWPPSAAASKSAPALVHVWNVASRVVNRSPRAAKFQWSPLRHRPDGSEPPAVPFQSIGLRASLTHSTRYASLAFAARATPIVGGSYPRPPGGALDASGGARSITSYRIVGPPSLSGSAVTEPSNEPPASYHCSGSDAFGTSGEGTRVQRARSVETTWSQWFWQHWWKTWYTPLYRRMPDASLIG